MGYDCPERIRERKPATCTVSAAKGLNASRLLPEMKTMGNNMEHKRSATLDLGNGNQPLEFPILSGSMGPDVVDFRKLHARAGVFTYDPGFLSTASSSSAITFIDGDEGVLLYRGYPIEQLAKHCDFMEVCYLLMNGE